MTPWPKYSKEEISAVSKVLKSGKVNYLFGNNGKEFEVEFSEFVSTKYSLALANGTLALDIALRAIGIKKLDEVIVTPRSYIASASCITLLGAIPIFVDVDYNSQNITAETISKAITKKTKAIICVHLAGMPCEMDAIMKLAKQNNLLVIEDCAQAHGASYKGRSVGSIGHIGTWSFCNDKIMTLGGEGGMITTNIKKYYDFAASFNNHGKNFKKFFSPSKDNNIPKFKYIHDSVGSNYRMTEMQSAIGRIQLKKMRRWNEIRSKNANLIYKHIEHIPCVKIPHTPNHMVHAFYKCYVMIDKRFLKKGWTRDKIIFEVNNKGVGCFSGSCPEIYLEKLYNKDKSYNRLPISRSLGEDSLMFAVHPTLSKQEIIRTKMTIRKVLESASKNEIN